MKSWCILLGFLFMVTTCMSDKDEHKVLHKGNIHQGHLHTGHKSPEEPGCPHHGHDHQAHEHEHRGHEHEGHTHEEHTDAHEDPHQGDIHQGHIHEGHKSPGEPECPHEGKIHQEHEHEGHKHKHRGHKHEGHTDEGQTDPYKHPHGGNEHQGHMHKGHKAPGEPEGPHQGNVHQGHWHKEHKHGHSGHSHAGHQTFWREIAECNITWPTRASRKKTHRNRKPFRPCVDNKCPSYTVKNKTKEYELRCYKKANWVMASVEIGKGEMKKKAKCETMRMFWKLFQYINGSNDKAEKINMTSPVLNKFSIGDDNKTVNMAMYFYIFREDGEDVPKPTDSSLRVVDDLKMCVYSHCFLSYHMRIRPWEMMRHVKMLKCALKEDGLENTVKKGSVFLAVYDGPEKRRRRRNEIWIQKEM